MAEFYDVFGVPKEKYRLGFEYKVNVNGTQDYIDSLLPNTILVEMKGQNRDYRQAKPFQQAYKYVTALDKDILPKYLLISNFTSFDLYKLDTNEHWNVTLKDLADNIDKFDFLAGYAHKIQRDEEAVNVEAANSISKLYNTLIEAKYPATNAALMMTRLVFALFADDTGIFIRHGQFAEYIEATKEDGSDLHVSLIELFEVLNTKPEERIASGVLADFPYINGGLFAYPMKAGGFILPKETRDALLLASEMDWSKISPVIFGSMFEGALDDKKRHDLGAHYTSEINILKVIDSLFMDELRAELEQIKELKRGKKAKLEEFHNKLTKLKFLDPASGSGNFLIVAYRELRRLEHQTLEAIIQNNNDENFEMEFFFIEENIKVEIAQFYGIEIVPYAVSIARVGLWLMDHLMNVEASNLFGSLIVRIPLHAGANVINADSLEIDWDYLLVKQLPESNSSRPLHNIDPIKFDYILGNPPFIGSKGDNSTTKEQKNAMSKVDPAFKKLKSLDYVAAWFVKAAKYVEKYPTVKVALVSTNSIVQGEQALTLWPNIFAHHAEIIFAHQTFDWDNNGAHVHVVIIGFAHENAKKTKKIIFSYPDIKLLPIQRQASHINEYLVDAPNVYLKKQSQNLSNLPKMDFGSIPYEYGEYLFSQKDAENYISKYPDTEKYFHQWIGASEMLHQSTRSRFVLYTKEMPLPFIKKHSDIISRIQRVKMKRAASKDSSTRDAALRPAEFKSDQYHKKNVLVIPRVTSSKREYIPVAFYDKNTIVGDAFQVETSDLYLFGILSSRHHRLWVAYLSGKMKSDFRYSNTMVYNTFVVPQVSLDLKTKIEIQVQKILEIREKYARQGTDLADMYDVLLMPSDLRKAHHNIDKLVDLIYSDKPFKSDEARVEILMKLYQIAISKKNKNQH